MRKCTICARPLDVTSDPMSANCGGDCWGCVGKIEADAGWQKSVDYVHYEINQGWRFSNGEPKYLYNKDSNKIIYYSILLMAFFPLICVIMMEINPSLGLLWFALHQMYYFPLASWIGPPFFQLAPEIVFKVFWPGRLIAAAAYCGFLSCLLLMRTKHLRKRGKMPPR